MHNIYAKITWVTIVKSWQLKDPNDPWWLSGDDSYDNQRLDHTATKAPLVKTMRRPPNNTRLILLMLLSQQQAHVHRWSDAKAGRENLKGKRPARVYLKQWNLVKPIGVIAWSSLSQPLTQGRIVKYFLSKERNNQDYYLSSATARFFAACWNWLYSHELFGMKWNFFKQRLWMMLC